MVFFFADFFDRNRRVDSHASAQKRNGKTLTIEMEQTAPQPAKNKRVFMKK
jgi:hypothetical protein